MPQEARAGRLGDLRPIPKELPTFVPLWQGRGREAHAFLLLNPVVFGLHTHWDGERILPCTEPLGACVPCSQRWDKRWRGFIGGASCRTKGRYLLQITAFAWRECELLGILDGQLRGRSFSVMRQGDKKQAPWIWRDARFPAVEPPFKPMDVPAILGRLWGIDLAALAEVPDFNGDVRPLMREFKSKKGGEK